MPKTKKELQNLNQNMINCFLAEKPFAEGLIAGGEQITTVYKRPLGLSEAMTKLAVYGAIIDPDNLEQTNVLSSPSSIYSKNHWISVHMFRDFPGRDEERGINYLEAINKGRKDVAEAFDAYEKGDKSKVNALVARASKTIMQEYARSIVKNEVLWYNTQTMMKFVKEASDTPENRKITGMDEDMERIYQKREFYGDILLDAVTMEDGPEKNDKLEMVDNFYNECNRIESEVVDSRILDLLPKDDIGVSDTSILMVEKYQDNYFEAQKKYYATHTGGNEIVTAEKEREWAKYKEKLFSENKVLIEKALKEKDYNYTKIEKVAKDNGLNDFKLVNKVYYVNEEKMFLNMVGRPAYIADPKNFKILRITTNNDFSKTAELVDELPMDPRDSDTRRGNLYVNVALKVLKEATKFDEFANSRQEENFVTTYNELKTNLANSFEKFDEKAKKNIIKLADKMDESFNNTQGADKDKVNQFTKGIRDAFAAAEKRLNDYQTKYEKYIAENRAKNFEDRLKASNEYAESSELYNVANKEKPVGNRSTDAQLYLAGFVDKFDGDAKNALKDLSELTAVLYTRDEDGNYPKFTAEIQKNLLNSYKKVKDEISKIEADNGVKKLNISEIKDIIANDVNLITSMDPSGNRSLAEEVENTNNIRVDTKDKNLSKVGAQSNQRFAMEFEKNGKMMKGFFTKEKSMIPDISKLLEETRNSLENDDEKAPYADIAVDIIKDYFEHSYPDRGEPAEIMDKYLEKHNVESILSDDVKKEDLRIVLQDFSDALSPEMQQYYSNICQGKNQYGSFMKADFDSNITGRNVAMSKVATILGVPDLIAKSEFMEIDDGTQVIKGVFMANAQGKDYNDIVTADFDLLEEGKAFDDKNVLKQIADMQILDFVCQNIDRHQNNFFYQFSNDGKHIVGIQGIDNDLSFGNAVQGDSQEIGPSSTTFENIKLVSESMKNRLFAIDGDMLKFTLKGTGITDNEINAAVTRLDKIKTAITAGTIKTYADKDFDGKTLEDFTSGNKESGSMFNRVFKNYKENMKVSAESHTDAKRKKEVEKQQRINSGKPVKEFKFEKLSEVGGISQAQFEKDSKLADDYISKISASQKNIWGKGSEEFRKLEAAMKAYKETVASFPKDPTDNDFLKMQAQLENVSESAKRYTDSKANVKKPNKKMQERLEIAKNIKEKFDTRLSEFKEGLHRRQEIETEEFNAQMKATAKKIGAFDEKTNEKYEECIKLGVDEKVAEVQANAYAAQQTLKAVGEGKIPFEQLDKKDLVVKIVVNDMILRERLKNNDDNALTDKNKDSYNVGQIETLIASGQGNELFESIKGMKTVNDTVNNMTKESAKKLSEVGGITELSQEVVSEIKKAEDKVKGVNPQEQTVKIDLEAKVGDLMK